MNQKGLDPTSLILIAVINNPRDLEIARILGWYRIPLRSAPKVISVDFIAFYQTAAFGDQKWRIQFLAPVLGHELTTRLELIKDQPEHPHAMHEYYKVQIGPLMELNNPILADGWRRITFFYTTGELLLGAHSLSDLMVGSEARQMLWRALFDRAIRADDYRVEDMSDLELSSDALDSLLGLYQIKKKENQTD